MFRKLLLLVLLIGGSAFAESRVYELRTYTANEGKLDDLLARFREHTVTMFKKHNIQSIGYWVPQDGERSKNTVIYVLAHPSREEAMKNWDAFSHDPEWMKIAADSDKNGKLVQKVDRVFMTPTDFSALK